MDNPALVKRLIQGGAQMLTGSCLNRLQKEDDMAMLCQSLLLCCGFSI